MMFIMASSSVRRLKPNERKVLAEIRKSCKSAGVGLILSDTIDVVPDDYDGSGDRFSCNGFYLSDGPAIVVATRNSEWMKILLHEYCHAIQHQSGRRFYHRHEASYWKWLSGRRRSRAGVLDAVRFITDLELDCEKMVISKFGHSGVIDQQEYMEKAQLYLYSYGASLRYRTWFRGFPSDSKEITSVLPGNWLGVEDYLFGTIGPLEDWFKRNANPPLSK